MDRYLNCREFLANAILKLISLGCSKIDVNLIFDVKQNFENIIKFHKIESVLLMQKTDIENFANKFYTFLYFDKEKQILIITNGDLAKMWLADFAVKGDNFNKYLNSAILKTFLENKCKNNNFF